MRLGVIIIGLTIIAVCVVSLRRQEVAICHDLQRLESQHATLRRELWDRQVEAERLLCPKAVRYRTEVMALDVTNETSQEAILDGRR